MSSPTYILHKLTYASVASRIQVARFWTSERAPLRTAWHVGAVLNLPSDLFSLFVSTLCQLDRCSIPPAVEKRASWASSGQNEIRSYPPGASIDTTACTWAPNASGEYVFVEWRLGHM